MKKSCWLGTLMSPVDGRPSRYAANASPLVSEVGLEAVNARSKKYSPLEASGVNRNAIWRKSPPNLIVWRPMNFEKLALALCEYHVMGRNVRSPSSRSVLPARSPRYPSTVICGNFLNGKMLMKLGANPSVAGSNGAG